MPNLKLLIQITRFMTEQAENGKTWPSLFGLWNQSTLGIISIHIRLLKAKLNIEIFTSEDVTAKKKKKIVSSYLAGPCFQVSEGNIYCRTSELQYLR